MPPREYKHYNIMVGITGFGCPAGKYIKPTVMYSILYRLILILLLPLLLPIPLLFGPIVGLIVMVLDTVNNLKNNSISKIMKCVFFIFGIPICLVLGLLIGLISLLILPLPIMFGHLLKLFRFLYYHFKI